MIHTSNIIDTSVYAWRQLLGNSIRDAEAFALPELDELCEIAFTLESTGTRMHVSSMQEDGKNDECLFYWLSMRDASHFKNGSVVPFKMESPAFASIVHTEIVSIKLFGHSATDAVYASLLQSNKATIAIATTRWLQNKQRFSQCGSEELAVLDGSALQSCVFNQGLELVADIK